MTDGVSGFVIDTIDQAVAAVRRIEEIDRSAVRAAFEERFSVDVMAANYEAAYRAVLGLAGGVKPAPMPVFVEVLTHSKSALGESVSLHKAEVCA